MIAIIDYGAGNLQSVKKAFDFIGVPTSVTADPAELLAAKTAILAGSISAALIGLIYMHFVCHKRA